MLDSGSAGVNCGKREGNPEADTLQTTPTGQHLLPLLGLFSDLLKQCVYGTFTVCLFFIQILNLFIFYVLRELFKKKDM